MKINFYQFGKRGRVIVFLHGWQQDGRSFFPLVPFLSQEYRLFFLDLPGFGASDQPPKNFDSKKYAQEILSWLKSQRLKKMILVGHSFGGKIAAILAAQEPVKIEKLILIAPAGIPHPKWWYPLKNKLPRSIRRWLRPKLAGIFASRDYRQAGTLLSVFKNIVKEDLRPIFSQINLPTLIIWGRQDRELPLADGKLIHQLIKESHLKIINKGDHFPFWQKPKLIAKMIKNFIQE